jgi:hypothetical protein
MDGIADRNDYLPAELAGGASRTFQKSFGRVPGFFLSETADAVENHSRLIWRFSATIADR